MYFAFFLWLDSSSGPTPPPCRDFEIKLRHTTLDRTLLGERSSRLRDLYLAKHNTHKRVVPLVGFEPAIGASKGPQTHALDRGYWERHHIV